MNKKILAIGVAAALSVTAVGMMAGCGPTGSGEAETAMDIVAAVAREAGSGTRSAFDELVANAEGNTIDSALETGALASVVSEESSTAAVITNVARSYGILGYASLGSYLENTDTVQAVNVNGVEATRENILSGDYELSRPFMLCYQNYDELSDLAKNLISFIESTEGQAIVGEDYINLPEVEDAAGEYTPYTGSETTLTITGSTSVEPLMQDLVAAFEAANPGNNFTVTITGSGSGAGIADAQEGRNDIGMSSRALTDEEKETLTEHQIATDGIAVIVKLGSELTNVTFDQLYNLYINGTPIVVGEED